MSKIVQKCQLVAALIPLVSPALDSLSQTVVINEIMYHSASGKDEENFVELYNPGSQDALLDGWQFTKGIQYTFPNIVVPPGGFLVVAENEKVFRTKYPEVTNVSGNWTGTLSHSGEIIELRDRNETTVSQVQFGTEGDWARRTRGPIDHGHRGWTWRSGHDGGGKSIELVDAGLPVAYGQNWMASLQPGGTPGRSNSVVSQSSAAIILDVVHSPAVPKSTNEILFTARIVSRLAASNRVFLKYRVDRSPKVPFET
ncbi:MAG: lamin tail domain-containing protein, partial [Verrucomicrobiota bacterium]